MTKPAVLWTDTARNDLESLVDYLAGDDPAAAMQVLDRLEQRAQTLGMHARRGRIVPELRAVGVLHYRELMERPWRIVYRIEASRVLVMAVLDSRRDLQSLLLERLIRS